MIRPTNPKTPYSIPPINPKTPFLYRLAKLFSNQQVQPSKNHCLVLNLHLPGVAMPGTGQCPKSIINPERISP